MEKIIDKKEYQLIRSEIRTALSYTSKSFRLSFNGQFVRVYSYDNTFSGTWLNSLSEITSLSFVGVVYEGSLFALYRIVNHGE